MFVDIVSILILAYIIYTIAEATVIIHEYFRCPDTICSLSMRLSMIWSHWQSRFVKMFDDRVKIDSFWLNNRRFPVFIGDWQRENINLMCLGCYSTNKSIIARLLGPEKRAVLPQGRICNVSACSMLSLFFFCTNSRDRIGHALDPGDTKHCERLVKVWAWTLWVKVLLTGYLINRPAHVLYMCQPRIDRLINSGTCKLSTWLNSQRKAS